MATKNYNAWPKANADSGVPVAPSSAASAIPIVDAVVTDPASSNGVAEMSGRSNVAPLLLVSEGSGNLSEVSQANGERFGFILHDVSRMHSVAYAQRMKPVIDITRGRRWMLARLARCDGMMQSQLASALEIGKASLGTVIKQLERDGLVQRRPDPIDKRAKRVYLSRKARHVIQNLKSDEALFNAGVFADLNPGEQQTLISLMSRVKGTLRDFNRGGADADPSE